MAGSDIDFEALHKEYLAWVRATFPDESVTDQITHLKEEVLELEEHPSDGGEYADVLMLLLCVADGHGIDILKEFQTKFSVNKSRTWHKTPAGYRHVKPL